MTPTDFEKNTKKLADIKEKVEQAHAYFKKNYDRYHDFINFVFNTSLSQEDEETLRQLGKPIIEFNVLESYVSRQRGEFAKHQPSLSVRAADGVSQHMLTPQFTKTIEVIEGYLRATFFDANNDKLQYNTFSDVLGGGFSVMEVYTDYINEMSLEQNIYVGRVFDPTLCGFDPLARESHKGDGRFCFQLYPKTKTEFEEEYGKEKAERMRFTRSLGGFGWSYHEGAEKIVMVCDFYEKKRVKKKLLKLSTGQTLLAEDYKKLLEDWEKSGRLEQPPVQINERMSMMETIVRYRICENGILDRVETNFKHFPLVFVDGNSVQITKGDNQHQMTRPYVYHARGIQQLKNFAGQSLGNELENLVQHKFIVAQEAIPEDYLEAYNDVQKASTLVYKHFLDRQSPEVTLPPPREVHSTGIPPEVTNTFRMSDEMTQVILGSYDSALGVNRQEISGAAIAMGAMQSNSASMPYIMGYIKGLNRVAQIMVDLIPKYYRTPRSLPVMLPSGKRSYEMVNSKDQPHSIYLNYDPNSLNVVVETGVNFAMQKELALKTLTGLMQTSSRFAEFMNEEGLTVLLDNIDIRGIDGLKAQSEKFQQKSAQKQSQMQQMQMQMAQMQQQLSQAKAQAEIQKSQAEAMKTMKEAQSPTPAEVGAARVEQEGQFKLAKLEQDAQFQSIEAKQAQEKVDLQLAEFVNAVQEGNVEQAMKVLQIDAENSRTAVESLHTWISAHKAAAELGETPTEVISPPQSDLETVQ